MASAYHPSKVLKMLDGGSWQMLSYGRQRGAPGGLALEPQEYTVTHYNNPEVLAQVSEDLGEAMVGINCDQMVDSQKFATRGW